MQARIAFESRVLVRWTVCDAVAAGSGSVSEFDRFDIDPETAYCLAADLGMAADPRAGGCCGQ